MPLITADEFQANLAKYKGNMVPRKISTDSALVIPPFVTPYFVASHSDYASRSSARVERSLHVPPVCHPLEPKSYTPDYELRKLVKRMR